MKANPKINAIYSRVKRAPKAKRLALLRAAMVIVSEANQTRTKRAKGGV